MWMSVAIFLGLIDETMVELDPKVSNAIYQIKLEYTKEKCELKLRTLVHMRKQDLTVEICTMRL